MTENHMIINGIRYPVINSWVDVESPSDGRRRWGIVTEAAEQAAHCLDCMGTPDTCCHPDHHPTDPCGRCDQPPAAHPAQDGHLWIRRMAYQDAEVQPQPAAEATAPKAALNVREMGSMEIQP